jgi:nicotinate-nucleotide--dimethylbenzimidazole phosphoribosyltransferase
MFAYDLDVDAAHWRRAATERLAALAKPPGSLGVLEDWAITLCVAQKTLAPTAEPASVVVFAGDHGVKLTDESLSPYPASATQAVFRALAAGVSCTATLARAANAQLVVVDVGVAGDLSRVEGVGDVVVEHRKVARGTADFRSGDAMDHDALAAALRAGADALTAAAARGAVCVAVGEVGIGNTTAAAALLAALTGEDAAACCGRGTGLDDQGLAHKVDTVRRALAFHGAGLAPREALRRLGGFEIAAMVGAYAAARAAGVVTLVDGSISAVAALCAQKMFPESRDRMLFATALAEEPGAAAGGAILARELAAKPALDMALRLGEASGAVLALPLARSAAALLGAGTLAEAMALSDA